MTASRESVAYQQYEERFTPARREPQRELREVPAPRSSSKNKARPGVVACIGVIILAAVAILFCQMRLTMLTAEITAQTERLGDLTAENVSLSSKQSYNLDMDQIESYAVSNLGMVKMDSSQIEYVELTNPDSITVQDSGVSLDALFAGLARSFSAVVEYIR